MCGGVAVCVVVCVVVCEVVCVCCSFNKFTYALHLSNYLFRHFVKSMFKIANNIYR